MEQIHTKRLIFLLSQKSREDAAAGCWADSCGPMKKNRIAKYISRQIKRCAKGGNWIVKKLLGRTVTHVGGLPYLPSPTKENCSGPIYDPIIDFSEQVRCMIHVAKSFGGLQIHKANFWSATWLVRNRDKHRPLQVVYSPIRICTQGPQDTYQDSDSKEKSWREQGYSDSGFMMTQSQMSMVFSSNLSVYPRKYYDC